MDYMINPVMMGGLVKEVADDQVRVHLHGRLGVITVPEKLIITDEKIKSEKLEPGHEMEFYFSYLQVVESAYDYDSAAMRSDAELTPSLLGGTIIEVNDTAAKVEIMEHMGTIAVPRRWLFTDVALETGQQVEFYMSPMRVIGKRDIPQESI
jgi:hypothetical protein